MKKPNKKQSKPEFNTNQIVLTILGLATIIILFAGFTTDWNFSNKPEFKITQEVCEEEEIYVQYWGNNKSKPVVDEYTLEQLRTKYRYKYPYKRDELQEFGCFVLKRHGLLNQSPVCVLLDKELQQFNVMAFDSREEIIIPLFEKEGYFHEIKQVCHQEEVDEIYLGETCIKDLQTNISACGRGSLSKEEITTEWLDEQTECIEGTGKDGTKPICGLKDCASKFIGNAKYLQEGVECSKWKLNNYTIEVLK